MRSEMKNDLPLGRNVEEMVEGLAVPVGFTVWAGLVKFVAARPGCEVR